MNKAETTQIIALLAGNYQTIADKTLEQKQLMLTTWHQCLEDLDYEIVLNAVKQTIIQSSYPPTIHDIRKNAIQLLKINTPRTAIEDWNECYNMICNGLYMTQEEFDSHSEICKKFLGSLNQLKKYSTNTEFNLDVVRSNFLKQHEIITKRANEEMLLPNNKNKLLNN